MLNERRMIVMCHLPRPLRLRDPEAVEGCTQPALVLGGVRVGVDELLEQIAGALVASHGLVQLPGALLQQAQVETALGQAEPEVGGGGVGRPGNDLVQPSPGSQLVSPLLPKFDGS